MKNALGEALRHFATATTPEDLRRRGIQRLRSVRLSHVAELLEEALDGALAERGVELGSQERRRVAGRARERLADLLRSRPDGAPRRGALGETVAAAAADLRAEVGEGEQEGRVALLERRIRKLSEALEEAEHELEKAAPDGGLRSGLRPGEGLDDPDERRREQKLGMMRDVYELNRAPNAE